MDTLAHGLYGVALAAKGRDEKLMFFSAVAGMLPDMVVYGVFTLRGFSIPDVPESSLGLYHWTHSLIVPAVLFVLLSKKWRVLAVSYALHIVFDIFTHTGLFVTQFLYPVSNFSISIFDYSRNLWFWEINYGILVGIFYLIYVKFYKRV